MLTEPAAGATIDWAALEAVRKRAEAAGDALDKAGWQALFTEAVKVAGRAAALDTLSLYGAPDWVPAATPRAGQSAGA